MRDFTLPDDTSNVACQSTKPSLYDEVRGLARNWSLELTPRDTEKFGTAVREHLPAGMRVHVTWLAGSEFGASVAAAAKLRAGRFQTVTRPASRRLPHRCA